MKEILQEGNKWFVVQYHAGCAGTDMAVKIQAANADEAIDMMCPEAWEWFWNYNTPDYQEDDCEEDSVGGIAPELDIWAEEYDPKEHDSILH